MIVLTNLLFYLYLVVRTKTTVYSGCDLEHWRDTFNGNICHQVFLHYNHVDGPFAEKNRYDGRPSLGLPSYCKIQKN